ncbi:alpha/beta-hydrolase [Cylindrobasidium torrendii FP15055 ss-10]|uniref:Alpha/beta-hydrolase n=1 Tax=Cylindrobasidium torrendii FP15055 ss-10 TaxID=1314674 RepID=A0A0D7BM79_9AGAR|nr:alpha/beta-hydrolase [Cylindrobasidium torrendii FP15055 ss-10]
MGALKRVLFLSSFFIVSAALLLRPWEFLIRLERLNQASISQPDIYSNDCEPSWWENLPAKEILDWTPCYDSFECARLMVPLNYSDPSGAMLVLALLQYPSQYRNDSSLYKGPLLLNPGGPGASGVNLAQHQGPMFSELVDNRFDIVGFDPRGIARSTRVNLFKREEERALWENSRIEEYDFRPDGFAMGYAESVILGRLAGQNKTALPHINTENTARDMLTIVQAAGFEKLNYWGLSYGSALGATFAAMFPDKVNRLIIDGVLDSNTWYNGILEDSLRDSDKVIQAFFDECYAAGPDLCALWGDSPDAVSANMTNIMSKIRARPVPVFTDDGYSIVDYATVRRALFDAVYRPYDSFQPFATALEQLSLGSGELMYNFIRKPDFQCPCSNTGLGEKDVFDGAPVVMCNDWIRIPSDFEFHQEYYERQAKSYTLGSLFAKITVCSHWPELEKGKFHGPFEGNTNFPILVIGNTADPVTPLASARIMAEGFSNAILLIQNSIGHCSLSANSPCTLQHIHDYLVNGILPTYGSICPTISRIFKDTEVSVPDEQAQLGLSPIEEHFIRIGEGLSTARTDSRVGPWQI